MTNDNAAIPGAATPGVTTPGAATPGATPFIRYEQAGSIVVLTLDRPESRNALGTLEDCADFAAAVVRAGADAAVSCIILTGAGNAFSAGGSIKAMKERSGIGPREQPADTRLNYRRGVQRVIEALWQTEVPMIAAINGFAIGLGLDIACLCDLRIAADSAKFASSFIKMGLVAGDGGAWILPRVVGLANASELMFTGATIDATRALGMGLVSQLHPAERLLSAAQALAATIVANPAKALRLSKRLLREGQQQRLADVMELSAAFQALAHETHDHGEAVDAFLGKRDPHFSGD